MSLPGLAKISGVTVTTVDGSLKTANILSDTDSLPR
jgi:hypothetical protein